MKVQDFAGKSVRLKTLTSHSYNFVMKISFFAVFSHQLGRIGDGQHCRKSDTAQLYAKDLASYALLRNDKIKQSDMIIFYKEISEQCSPKCQCF